jgi:hypothetical protein
MVKFHNFLLNMLMEQRICAVPVAPLRSEPNHRSEMVSQLLLGEVVTCQENSGDFVLIRNQYDEYTGWCQRSQLLLIEGLAAAFIQPATWNGFPMQVPLGAPVGNLLQLNFPGFTYEGKLQAAGELPFDKTTILSVIQSYHQVPYLWGGKSVFGIDCSGFCQQVYRFFGKRIPRDASQQALVGEMVGFLEEAQCGDLAFFESEEGKITHVGLLLTSREIMHASGKVRVDDIDQWGIINRDTGQRTHTLRLIRRYQ